MTEQEMRALIDSVIKPLTVVRDTAANKIDEDFATALIAGASLLGEALIDLKRIANAVQSTR